LRITLSGIREPSFAWAHWPAALDVSADRFELSVENHNLAWEKAKERTLANPEVA